MLKNKLLPYALLALSQGVLAAEPLGAGGQLQQIPPVPVQQKLAPQTDYPPSPAAPVPVDPASPRMVVKSLRITGAQAYSEGELLAVSGFRAGSELSLPELRGLAGKITEHYHRHGYFTAQAYLPAQDVKDGALTLVVMEGRYGKIILKNSTNVSDGIALGLISGLHTGDPITSGPLESNLLRLSDLPGVKVKSTLVPGAGAGVSDLIVDLLPGAKISGEVDADNAGNRYTGAYRVGATVNLNEPFGLGDVASLRVLTSGNGMQYGRASYQLQLGQGRVGVSYSMLDYELGKEFESLGAHGTAQVASIFGSYPLIRSRNSNLSVALALDAKKFADRVDATGGVNDKKAQVAVASLYGDHRDALGGGGQNAYSVSLSAGNIDIDTPGVRAFDDATAQTNGSYQKLGFSAMRLQRLNDSLALYASVNGQLASKNLDISEKMELGGMYGVRAYPEGEAYGDQGYVVNLELRQDLPWFSRQIPGLLQGVGFVDTGHVTINKNPWATGKNSRTLSGAGLGFNWISTKDFMVRAYYAVKLGNETALSAPDRSGRFWIQLVKYF